MTGPPSGLFGPPYPAPTNVNAGPYDQRRDFFRAKLTAKTLVSGQYLYDWVEQTHDSADGTSVAANPARSGGYAASVADSPGMELNNAAIDLTSPVYVMMRQKGFVGGQIYYEFEYAATSSSSVSSWKAPVRVATTASGTLSSSFENGDSVDGVTLATGDRILIKNQSSPSENGIYTVNASGAPTRATDADTGAELLGATVVVTNGTANADSIWECTADATITVGSTSLPWLRIYPMLSGSSTGSSTFGLSTGGFEDVGHSITLPAAGTYLVTARETAQGAMSTIPGFASGEWTMRLYDVTNGAPVPDTITTVMNIAVTGKAQQQSTTVTAIVTVTGATVIRTEGKIGLTASQVYASASFIGGGGGGSNENLMTYTQIR